MINKELENMILDTLWFTEITLCECFFITTIRLTKAIITAKFNEHSNKTTITEQNGLLDKTCSFCKNDPRKSISMITITSTQRHEIMLVNIKEQNKTNSIQFCGINLDFKRLKQRLQRTKQFMRIERHVVVHNSTRIAGDLIKFSHEEK